MMRNGRKNLAEIKILASLLKMQLTSITITPIKSEALGSSWIGKSSQIPKTSHTHKNLSAFETLYFYSLLHSNFPFLCHVSQVIPTCEIKYLSSIRGAWGNDEKRETKVKQEKWKQRKGKEKERKKIFLRP